MEDKDIKTNDMKGKDGWQRIINSAHYSKDGFIAAFRHEAAFRQLSIGNAVLFIAVWCFDFSAAERMMLIAASFLSIIVELFNTGIEATIDYISLEKHPLAKRAKDVSSAAQFMAMCLIGILWLIALFG